MIMLIRSALAVKRRFLRRHSVIVDNRTVLGMKVMEMTVPIPERMRERQKERLKRKVLTILTDLRINAICVKDDFPYQEWFADHRRLTGNDVMKRNLGKIAVMASNRHELVYVYMQREDRECLKAITDLCEGFRLVCVSVQNGEASRITDSIMRSCGASIITEPTAERISSADAAVFFAKPAEDICLSEACVSVDIETTDVEFCMADGTKPDIPDGYSQKALISEVILRGCIRFEDIQISRIKISP